MKTKECVAIARSVWDRCKFSYAPRGMEIMRCAKYMQKVCDGHPDLTYEHARTHLPYVAKHFYISENNQPYAVYHPRRQKAV